MAQQTGKKPPPKAMRWGDADWAWLGAVAKSVGLSRSEFVRRSAMLAARATASGLSPYFVSGHAVPPQNTTTSEFGATDATAAGDTKAMVAPTNPISRAADHRAKTRSG